MKPYRARRAAMLWAVPPRGVRGDSEHGRVLAAYLSDMPVRRVGWPDVCLSTHRRVRTTAGSRDERVHDVAAFGQTTYRTRCGTYVNKNTGVLTALTANCRKCVAFAVCDAERAETKTPAAGTCNPGGER